METQTIDRKQTKIPIIMKQIPSVAVVILNWNGQKLLSEFLPSVIAHTPAPTAIILADNASTDESIAWTQTNYPAVITIKNQENLGFAAGYNLALANLNYDYFVLLNSDVAVTENWITPIIELMENDTKIAVCQPKILSYNSPESFEYAGAAGGYMDLLGYPFCRGRIFETVEKDSGQYHTNEEIFWASGAAFFVRADLFKLAGGFDKDYFAHMEEIDLCWRLKNMGYKIMACNESTVYHLGGGTLSETNPQKTYLNFRNSLYTLRKNLPLHNAFGLLLIRHVLDLVAMLKFLLSGKFKHAFAINRAHYAFLTNQRTCVNKRKDLLKLFKKSNKTGQYKRSIVYDYYILKKRKFTDLSVRNFFR